MDKVPLTESVALWDVGPRALQRSWSLSLKLGD